MDQSRTPSNLGRSLRLEDGDIVVDVVDGKQDLQMVSGTDNLLQCLRILIGTGLGTDIVNVAYGFDLRAFFSAPATVRATKDLVRLNLVKTISMDPRVMRVEDVSFDDEPSYAEILPAADPDAAARRRATRAWNALVTLRAVDGSGMTLHVSGRG